MHDLNLPLGTACLLSSKMRNCKERVQNKEIRFDARKRLSCTVGLHRRGLMVVRYTDIFSSKKISIEGWDMMIIMFLRFSIRHMKHRKSTRFLSENAQPPVWDIYLKISFPVISFFPKNRVIAGCIMSSKFSSSWCHLTAHHTVQSEVAVTLIQSANRIDVLPANNRLIKFTG